MSRKVDYFIKADIAPVAEACEMIDLDMRYVPHILRGMEAQKTRSFWVDDDDWIRGAQRLCIQQWRMLMPCSEDLIQELRALRGSIPSGEPTDLETYPVGTYPGIVLADVVGSLNTNGRSAALILASIETILQEMKANEELDTEALGRIVLLLGGAI